MIILIHSSKTMKAPEFGSAAVLTQPILLAQATELAQYLKTLALVDIVKVMKVSDALAQITKELLASWSDDPKAQRPAIDSFLGDIYSGLQVASLTTDDRLYANEHLRILSGLYGVLKPLDGIFPYRFEMGYKVPDDRYANLYRLWGSTISDTFAKNETIIDLSAVEYGKTVTKYIESTRIVTPRFLTINSKTGEPVFVVVHAKIARGAFAHWIIRNKIETRRQLKDFTQIGYRYDEKLSTADAPVYVCAVFQGLGLSVRLS